MISSTIKKTMGSCCGRPLVSSKIRIRSHCLSACCKAAVDDTTEISSERNNEQTNNNIYYTEEENQELLELREMFEARENGKVFERDVENGILTKRQKRKLRKRKNKRKNRSNRRRRYVNRMKRRPPRQPQPVPNPSFRDMMCPGFN